MERRLLFIRLLCVLLPCLLLAGCAARGVRDSKYITCLADMKDMELAFGFPDDLDFEKEIRALCPNATLHPQSDILAIGSVASGKLDCYAAGVSYLESYMAEHEDSGLVILDEPLIEYRSALGLCDSTPIDHYIDRVNEGIAMLRDEGILEDIQRRWGGEDETMPEIPAAENPEYTLKVATFGQQKPYTYVKDNQVVGSDVEIAYRLAAYLGCGIELETASFPSMLMGVSEGKYDMIASNLYITEERTENMTFSDSYQSSLISVIVREDPAANSGKGSVRSWPERLARSFRNTLVNEDRWRMLLSGLGVTMLITAGGFFLANLFGAAFSAMALSGNRFLRALEDIYSRIMQGTPIVVILMILYYVILGKSKISGIWVAIIGFGISSGAGLSQLFCGGITAVDNGQKEASLALGFTRAQTFFGITMPQAVRTMLPGYFSNLIALMKGTAIVGYIAVLDLTKSSDIIRASTFEAFFPLITVAVVYFLIACILLSVMKFIQRKLAPKRRTGREVEK